MTVWIDPPVWPAHGTVFSHVVSDHSYDELHAVAARAGVPRRAFDGDHYDIAAERYADLVRAGATPTTGGELVRRLNASGLRLRKRQGDRGLARLFHQSTPFGPATLDVVGSRRPVAGATHVAILTPDADPWGVVWGEVGIESRHAHGSPVGWLRVTTPSAEALVQVLSSTAAPLPQPWNYFAASWDQGNSTGSESTPS